MDIKGLIFYFSVLMGTSACFSQSPGVRNGHAMVYDISSHAIILFGGADEAKVYGDTWSYDKGKWKRLSEVGPLPRTFPCMVVADNYILLFGGNAVLFGNEKNPIHYLDDTWKLQDGIWKKVSVNIHPGPRAEAAMAYDPLRKKVILFGGRQAGEKWVAGDSWEFDGDKWEQTKTDGPTPRSGAIMTYDSDLKQIVLFGGNPVISKEKGYNGPMWSFDGDNWNPINSTMPLIFNTCLAYNTVEHFMLRFGGWDGEKRINETCIYRHKNWEKLDLIKAPAARNHSIMVYNPNDNAFLLYGGHDGENVFGDMWEFKNGKWKLLFAEGPLKRLDNGQ